MSKKPSTRVRRADTIKSFIVNRATWHRGADNSELRTSKGTVCCLGFLAKECVNKQVAITTCATPGALDEWYNRRFFPSSFYSKDADYLPRALAMKDIVETIIYINDDVDTDDKHKEAKLKPLFLKLGLKVKFVGKTSKKIKEMQQASKDA